MIRLPAAAAAAAVVLIAGCASVPPLPANHPASPDAPEGARVTRQALLRADETTRKTSAMLSAAQKDQEHWDAYGPVSGTPEYAPKNKPETKHEHP